MLTVEKQNRTSFQASITIHYSCWITSQPVSSIWGLCVMISCHHFVYSWLLRARKCDDDVDDPPHSHIQKQPHLTSWHALTQIAWGQNLNTESKTQIHEEETAERTTHFFFHPSYFWEQTGWTCTEPPSVTMVLWFERRVAFVGPAVCLLLVDNDIMTEESTQTDNSTQSRWTVG